MPYALVFITFLYYSYTIRICYVFVNNDIRSVSYPVGKGLNGGGGGSKIKPVCNWINEENTKNNIRKTNIILLEMQMLIE